MSVTAGTIGTKVSSRDKITIGAERRDLDRRAGETLPCLLLNSVMFGHYLCRLRRRSWPSMPKYPWNDYSGRLSSLKLGVFVLLFVPAGSVAFGYATHTLGPRELHEAIRRIGLRGIRLIFIALAVTPLRQILEWRRLLLVRRMIGVAAFDYIFVHFLLYADDQTFDVPKIASEIMLRVYLTIGFTALLGLAALGEATFFHLAYHAPLLLVLQTNLILITGLRPAPIVPAVGLAVTLAGALRDAVPSARRRLRMA
jgi:DMSO/TMAO reductase YedYZ heme-binding membrane subunit